MPAFWVLTSVAVLSSISCRGEPQIPAVPETIDYIAGPASVSLGKIADLKIPAGYIFFDSQAAHKELSRLIEEKGPRKGLLGLMRPEVGNWWVLLEYSQTGFVNGKPADINADAVLKEMMNRLAAKNETRNKQGLASVTRIDWELKPKYDAADHTLEWAIRAETHDTAKSTAKARSSGKTVNQTLRLLGRHGVLDAVVVRPYEGFTDLAPLKALLRDLVFKPGERYVDFQKGDKVYPNGLTELVASETDAERSMDAEPVVQAARASNPLSALWMGLGVVAGIGFLGVLVASRLRKRHPVREQRQVAPAPAHRPEPAMAAHGAVPMEPELPLGPTQGVAPAPAALMAGEERERPVAPRSPMRASSLSAKAKLPSSAKTTLNHRRNGAQRRKVFDYNRYFADLMSTVSNYSSSAENQPANGRSHQSTNGSQIMMPAATTNGNGHGSAPAQANLNLIASQAAFIEEQRRLMQEQSRLIEEKSKLIAEKNELLKLQSELIDNKVL